MLILRLLNTLYSDMFLIIIPYLSKYFSIINIGKRLIKLIIIKFVKDKLRMIIDLLFKILLILMIQNRLKLLDIIKCFRSDIAILPAICAILLTLKGLLIFLINFIYFL